MKSVVLRFILDNVLFTQLKTSKLNDKECPAGKSPRNSCNKYLNIWLQKQRFLVNLSLYFFYTCTIMILRENVFLTWRLSCLL